MESVPAYYHNQIQSDGSEGTYLDELKMYFGEKYPKIIEFFKDGHIWNTEEHDKEYYFEISYNHNKDEHRFISRMKGLKCTVSNIEWGCMNLSIYVDKDVIEDIINSK